jgi:hypothetical protein
MSGFLGGNWLGRSAFGGGIAIPADPVPVAGAELLTNGGFETGDPPTGWTLESATASQVADPRTGSAGIKALSLANNGGIALAYRSIANAANQWLMLNWWGKRVSVDAKIILYSSGFSAIQFSTTASATWANLLMAARATTTNCYVAAQNVNGTGTNEARYDDFSAAPLTLSSLISTLPCASANCDLSAAIWRTAGTQAGLCARLDSATSPANFIIAYESGAGRVRVDKCVAGVYTNVIDGAVTYSAGATLRLVCSGNDVSCYYNGTQVGTTQTVSDAGIVSNVRHGKFSTYASNTLVGYVAA